MVQEKAFGFGVDVECCNGVRLEKVEGWRFRDCM